METKNFDSLLKIAEDSLKVNRDLLDSVKYHQELVNVFAQFLIDTCKIKGMPQEALGKMQEISKKLVGFQEVFMEKFRRI